MARTDLRGTAKIYDLSAFRRARLVRQDVATVAKPERLSGGGAWYHEAAIREEEPGRRP